MAEEPGDDVLVVCTANVCRSPLGCVVLAVALDGQGWLGGLTIGSAGVAAQAGDPMCRVSGTRLGDDAVSRAYVDEHRSRLLDRALVDRAALVLTAEREHRGQVARLAPGSQSKVFTWREAEALAAAAATRVREGVAAAPEDAAALARLLHALRGTVPTLAPPPERHGLLARLRGPAEGGEDPLTVRDGHGSSPKEHDAALDDTVDVLSALGDRLVGMR